MKRWQRWLVMGGTAVGMSVFTGCGNVAQSNLVARAQDVPAEGTVVEAPLVDLAEILGGDGTAGSRAVGLPSKSQSGFLQPTTEWAADVNANAAGWRLSFKGGAKPAAIDWAKTGVITNAKRLASPKNNCLMVLNYGAKGLAVFASGVVRDKLTGRNLIAGAAAGMPWGDTLVGPIKVVAFLQSPDGASVQPFWGDKPVNPTKRVYGPSIPATYLGK